MTPSARLQAAIEILEALRRRRNRPTASCAIGFAPAAMPAPRIAPPSPNACLLFCAIALRFAWRMHSEEPRALVIATLLADGAQLPDIEALFDGAGYGAKPLSEDERPRSCRRRAATRRFACRANFPPFWKQNSARSLGAALLDEMRAMQARAPVDLRVNTFKASRDDVLLFCAVKVLTRHPRPMRHTASASSRARVCAAAPPRRVREWFVRIPGRSGADRGAAVRCETRRMRFSISRPAPAARRWRSRPR